MEAIKNAFYNGERKYNSFLRFVNKTTKNYVDIPIPGGSSENHRKIFKIDPDFFAGYSHSMEKSENTYDYYFLMPRETKEGTIGVTVVNIDGKLVIINFDNDNLPVLTDELNEILNGKDIYKYLNMDYIDNV